MRGCFTDDFEGRADHDTLGPLANDTIRGSSEQNGSVTSLREMKLLDSQIKWAREYNAYGRLAGESQSDGALGRLLESAREEWRRSGHVPDWCGVDLLRGWAFHLVTVGRPALEPSGPQGPELTAVLTAVAAHPHAMPFEAPPLEFGDAVVLSVTDRTEALEDLWGDQDPWVRHLPLAWRACAEPSVGDYPHHPRPRIENDWSSFEAHIAFFSPLLHLLLYGLGWSRPALGLARWIEQGRPTEEPVLAVVDRWWGREVDSFVAWLAGAPNVRDNLRETMTGLPSSDEGRRTPYLDAFNRLRTSEEWLSVWGGGWDEMHLSGHVLAPLTESKSAPRFAHASTTGSAVPRAVLMTPAYAGWYAALRAYPEPTRFDGHDLRVDVVCPALGWLGEYRRSATTGLWFRGRHAIHVLGN